MNEILLPPQVLGPLCTAIGGLAGSVLTVIFGPKVLWNIEQQRERLKARRELVAQWRAMTADVAQLLAQRRAGDITTALELLERHQAYQSLQAAHARYELSGLRGIGTRFGRSRFRRRLYWLRRPPLVTPPEQTFIVGSSLPARLLLTQRQIADVARWWGLD